MDLLALMAVNALLMGTVTGEEIPQVSKLRYFGPYGHRQRPSGTSGNNNYDLSNLVQNQQFSTQSFLANNANDHNNRNNKLSIQDFYNNHNPGYATNTENYGNGNAFSQQYDDSYNSANSFSDANSFNGFGFDVKGSQLGNSGGNSNRGVFDNFNGQNSHQVSPDRLNRRQGSEELSDLDWSAIRKSSYAMIEDGVGGGGGGGEEWGGEGGGGVVGGGSNAKLSIDVYSLLALAMFTAFIAYMVYYFITDTGGGRSHLDRQSQVLMAIFDDVTNAFERWAVFEYLPDYFPEVEGLRLLKG